VKKLTSKKLMTKALARRCAQIGKQDTQNPLLLAKLFDTQGMAVFFVTEFEPAEEKLTGFYYINEPDGSCFFAYDIEGLQDFTLDELKECQEREPGFTIVRDLSFMEKRLSEIPNSGPY
jgi:hypothetical protein